MKQGRERKQRGREKEMGESREGERYIPRVGVDVAVVEGDRAAGDAIDPDAPALPNMEGARVLVSCWKALP